MRQYNNSWSRKSGIYLRNPVLCNITSIREAFYIRASSWLWAKSAAWLCPMADSPVGWIASLQIVRATQGTDLVTIIYIRTFDNKFWVEKNFLI
jgi:hypothetical protein